MNRRPSTLKIFSILFIGLSLLVISGVHSSAFAEDDISVTRDDDKTVYSIDDGDEARRQQERDRNQAIDMLKNMPVITDGRRGQPLPPRPVQPVQPTPGN
jgi:hypothetical protein